MFTQIDKGCLSASADRPLDRMRHNNAARFSKSLKAGCDVHAIAIDRAVCLLNDVPEVHTNSKMHAPIYLHRQSKFQQLRLHFHRRAHSASGGIENRKHRVACHVNDAATMLGDMRTEYLARSLQRFHRLVVVKCHQARVPYCVCSEYREQTAMRIELEDRSDGDSLRMQSWRS